MGLFRNLTGATLGVLTWCTIMPYKSKIDLENKIEMMMQVHDERMESEALREVELEIMQGVSKKKH